MKRIVVPCDFSEVAQKAYTFALDIARRTDGEVFVVRALDLPFTYENPLVGAPYVINTEDLMLNLKNDARERFKKMKAEHGRQNDISFETVQGPVTQSVCNLAASRNADLIVMGTKGASGLSELFIGSNTERVVRFSPVPVLAVRKAVRISSIKNIVFPTALEPGQVELVNKIKALQDFFDAQLHLVVVNTPYNLKRTSDEKSSMEDYARQHELKNYTLYRRNDFSEQGGIMHFVKEIHGDMIAMGTNNRTGLSHLFRGSIAEDMVNHTDVPIWTYSLRHNSLQS